MKFGTVYRYKNNLEKMMKIIEIYILLNPKAEKLINREKEALAFYMLYGYNENSLKDIESGLSSSINNGYVRTLNNNLRKKGYMYQDSRNYKINHLSEDMQKLKENYVDKKDNIFVIGFKK